MDTSQDLKQGYCLAPQYRDYVWGGNRLRPGQSPTAEAWIVAEDDQIIDGPLAGLTLSQAVATYGAALLGMRVAAQTGAERFPLLIKLLDCAQWLSLQVHPNDAQAVSLEGAGHFGKTEAWHVLEADPGAEILAGLRPGVRGDEWREAVRNGSILNYTQRLPLRSGQSIFIRPGTMHALGPGLLVYEVQQTSDITYRVFDWNRPVSSGRKLHIDQSLAVIDPSAYGEPVDPPDFKDGERTQLVACPYFTLELLTMENTPIALHPAGQTFHILTVIDGQVNVSCGDWSQTLNKFDTVLIPANLDNYQVRPLLRSKVLKASVEEITG